MSARSTVSWCRCSDGWPRGRGGLAQGRARAQTVCGTTPSTHLSRVQHFLVLLLLIFVRTMICWDIILHLWRIPLRHFYSRRTPITVLALCKSLKTSPWLLRNASTVRRHVVRICSARDHVQCVLGQEKRRLAIPRYLEEYCRHLLCLSAPCLWSLSQTVWRAYSISQLPGGRLGKEESPRYALVYSTLCPARSRSHIPPDEAESAGLLGKIPRH